MYNLEDIDVSNLKIRIRDTIHSILGWYRNKNDEKNLILLEINTFIFMEFINQYNYIHAKKISIFLNTISKIIYIIFLNNNYKILYDKIDSKTLLEINKSCNSYYHRLNILFKNAQTIKIEKTSIISKNYVRSPNLENINPYVVINCSIEHLV